MQVNKGKKGRAMTKRSRPIVDSDAETQGEDSQEPFIELGEGGNADHALFGPSFGVAPHLEIVTGARLSNAVRGPSPVVARPSTAARGPSSAIARPSTTTPGPSVVVARPSTTAPGPSSTIARPSTALPGLSSTTTFLSSTAAGTSSTATGPSELYDERVAMSM